MKYQKLNSGEARLSMFTSIVSKEAESVTDGTEDDSK
jgi:hypothetical protein